MWDYPRPPRVSLSSREVVVVLHGVEVARSSRAFRVLETSHPPGWYVPRPDVADVLTPTGRTSFCEFKGTAVYWTVLDRVDAAWSYPRPSAGYEELADAVAFYPSMMDSCTVDGEVVRPQAGGFYGGWITSDVSGPFKGEPGTRFW